MRTLLNIQRRYPKLNSGAALSAISQGVDAAGQVIPQSNYAGDSAFGQDLLKRQQQNQSITNIASGLMMSSGEPLTMGVGLALKAGSMGDAAIQKGLTDEDGFYKNDTSRMLGNASEAVLNPVASFRDQFDLLTNKDYSMKDRFFNTGDVQKQEEEKAKEQLYRGRQVARNAAAANASAGAYGNAISLGRYGGKILSPKRTLKNGGPIPEVQILRRGGAIITGGQRHEEVGPYGKGNPVVDAAGKLAETEEGELMLSLLQTKDVMQLVGDIDREPNNADTYFELLGKEMEDIIKKELIDNSKKNA